MFRRLAILLALVAVSRGGVRAEEAASGPPADVFRLQIEPLVAQSCVECHGGDEPAGELALAEVLSRGSVGADRETWDKMARRLRDREMPPEDGEPLEDAKRDTLVAWIEAELAKDDCSGVRDPGRVTIRRLNRNEYNNTIRDLLGVDFRPANDFPADDVGYGFDNIGDVLSMPPILLEKYLTAAQDVVDRALGVNLTNLVSKDSIAGGSETGDGFRVLTSQGDVTAKFHSRAGKHYILRVRAFGDQAGDEPVKMRVSIDDQPVREFEVRAVANHAELYEAWLEIPRRKGEVKLAVSFLNDFYQPDLAAPNDRNLYVGRIELLGPYPDTYKQIIPREHTPEDRQLVARETINRLMSRTFRRASTAAEVDRVLQLVETVHQDGGTFIESIGLGLQAMLVSPHFLFRVERDPAPDDPDRIRDLDDFEVATRLSYFLWSSMPDDELFELARQGSLRKDGNLEKQVRRMLADEKSQALVENFAGQWLQLRNLNTVTPDKGVYGSFDEELRTAMRQETEMFFAAIMREDRSVLEFLDAEYTFVNDRLAKHYGLPDVEGKEFRRVSLDPSRRGGVLGQASVLTVTSNPTRTSPVKRGKWVLDNLLGTPPADPPPDVPPLEEKMLVGTLRQRMEQHRENAACASCHKVMDPLGFGLENYDGVGAWRDKDGEFAIDASGELPNGQKFAGPQELRQVLKSRQDDFLHCLAEKMLTYGLGRGVEYSDRCTVREIAASTAAGEYKFSSLILAVVASDAFQKRSASREVAEAGATGKEAKP
jgi:mono/diheme cytochrome c family protein